MFGRGKSSDATAKKTKKRSGTSIPWKALLLNHIEKIAIGIFLAFTGYLIYNGLSAKTYDNSRSPEDLANRAQQVKNEIEKVDHWDRMKAKVQMPSDFVKQVDDARKDTDPTPYFIDNIPEKRTTVSGEKRGDPELFAPIEVQGNSFYGTIAVNSPKASKADELLNAPPVGDGKRQRKPPTTSTPPRSLGAEYDLGFQIIPTSSSSAPPTSAPGRLGRPVETRVVPKISLFNVVTAAVPHERMVESYKKEFASATGYTPDRDSPNYLGYEVQRVDVTDKPERDIDEAEWKEATGCMLDGQLKEKNNWAGGCDEIVSSSYVVDSLTMPIPPILLTDYRYLASSPLIPRLDVTRKTPGSGTHEPEHAENKRSSTSEVSLGSNETSGGANSAAEEDPKNIPMQLAMSTYKLLRFVDFSVSLGRTYRYRVRLALEDPNYTRAKSYSPRTSEMKSETVARIQKLETADADAEKKHPPGKKFERNSRLNTPWSQPSLPITTRRPVELYSSKAIGNWISMKIPNGKNDIAVETLPIKATIVYAEWSQDLAMLVPHKKTDVERGSVLSGVPTTATFSELGLDAIHPVSKIIKWVAGFKFSTPVTIADIRGGQPLAAEKRGRDKDPLPSGGEVVAFDPTTGELVISREFESITPFQMLSFTDEKPAESGP